MENSIFRVNNSTCFIHDCRRNHRCKIERNMLKKWWAMLIFSRGNCRLTNLYGVLIITYTTNWCFNIISLLHFLPYFLQSSSSGILGAFLCGLYLSLIYNFFLRFFSGGFISIGWSGKCPLCKLYSDSVMSVNELGFSLKVRFFRFTESMNLKIYGLTSYPCPPSFNDQ